MIDATVKFACGCQSTKHYDERYAANRKFIAEWKKTGFITVNEPCRTCLDEAVDSSIDEMDEDQAKWLLRRIYRDAGHNRKVKYLFRHEADICKAMKS
jgi:hypothetical protein